MFTYNLACAELVGVQPPQRMVSSLALLSLAIVCLSPQSNGGEDNDNDYGCSGKGKGGKVETVAVVMMIRDGVF